MTALPSSPSRGLAEPSTTRLRALGGSPSCAKSRPRAPHGSARWATVSSFGQLPGRDHCTGNLAIDLSAEPAAQRFVGNCSIPATIRRMVSLFPGRVHCAGNLTIPSVYPYSRRAWCPAIPRELPHTRDHKTRRELLPTCSHPTLRLSMREPYGIPPRSRGLAACPRPRAWPLLASARCCNAPHL